MKTLAALFFSMMLCAGAVQAQDKGAPAKKPTAQQEKMGACNKQAGEKKLSGEERKKFMSECLKAKPAATAQQSKMKSCNQDASAKQLKGEERKKFMSECLKG